MTRLEMFYFVTRVFFIAYLDSIVVGKSFTGQNKNCGTLLQSHRKGFDFINHVNIPWAAFLINESKSSKNLPITGSIISPTLVITDGYVFYDTKLNQISVKQNYSLVYGSHKLSKITKQGKRVKVSHITVHPDYISKDGWYNRENDVALVHLETPIQIDGNIQPACLPELSDYRVNMDKIDNLYIYGWNKNYTGELIGMKVGLMSTEVCDSYWTRLFRNNYLGDRICTTVSEGNEQQLCVTHPLGVFYLSQDRLFIAGTLNNFYSKQKLCSTGSLNILWRFSDQTINWIKNSERCGLGNFTCFSDGKCIPKSRMCDFQQDCSDKSDEQLSHCNNAEVCARNEFKCQIYGKCILKSKVLDGNPDCPDGEDEKEINSGAGVLCNEVSVVIALIAFTLVVFYRLRIRSYQKQIRDLTEEELTAFYKGEDLVQLSNGLTQASANHSYTNLPSYINYINTGVLLQAWSSQYEIPSSKLQIGDEIGRGNFGIVYKGVYVSRYVNLKTLSVNLAIKVPKLDVDVEEFKNALREIKIMAHVGTHENIVSFIGACTENIRKRSLYIVLEYCPKGSLLAYLRQQDKRRFLDKFNQSNMETSSTSVPSHYVTLNENLSTLDLLKWASQIASGMMYLETKNIIHGDLASRNVLLSEDLCAKIGDFGLSRELNGSNIYDPIPWKWMAIESLTNRMYSFKSDVWAYGVVLWELFSLGEEPYGDICWSAEFVKELIRGFRLPHPPFAPQEIYNTMLETWSNDSGQRPTISKLQENFAVLREALKN